MYEHFGAREDGGSRRAAFRLFVPDNALDPAQYARGALPGIDRVYAVGDFQAPLGAADWTPDPRFELTKAAFTDPEDGRTKGWLYKLVTDALPAGFYQYKYHVTYASGHTPPRRVCDPCTRYGGAGRQNSGFVIGGPDMQTAALAHPRPLGELVLYELMIDDFTANVRGNDAPLAAVQARLDHLQRLGVTGVQFMPWAQWPGEGYNWGYEPQGFFAVAFRYTRHPTDPSEKLFMLKRLVSACHARGLHVLLDGVFDHATGTGAERGFGYHWLWERPEDSPYTGTFAGAGYGTDLDFANGCTEDFIVDMCRYWVDEFAVDGIRFDYTLGFYNPGAYGDRGLPRIVRRLRAWLDASGRTSFPLILEHEWNYSSVDVTNQVGATGCWLDPFRSQTRDYLAARRVRPGILRLLDAARDFAPGSAPVTYLENHDHAAFALAAGPRDEWWRMQPYLIGLFTAAGAPMLHNGQEFGERYPMPEQDDASAPSDSRDPARRRVVPRPLRWSQLADGPGEALFGLCQRLIALRTAHAGLALPNFHPRGWDEGRGELDDDGFGIDEDRQVVVYHRWGDAADGRLEKFFVVLNFSDEPQPVALTFPEDGGWVDLLSGWAPPVEGGRLRLQVGSHWGHVFHKRY